jgi:hypothetical protein
VPVLKLPSLWSREAFQGGPVVVFVGGRGVVVFGGCEEGGGKAGADHGDGDFEDGPC